VRDYASKHRCRNCIIFVVILIVLAVVGEFGNFIPKCTQQSIILLFLNTSCLKILNALEWHSLESNAYEVKLFVGNVELQGLLQLFWDKKIEIQKIITRTTYIYSHYAYAT